MTPHLSKKECSCGSLVEGSAKWHSPSCTVSLPDKEQPSPTDWEGPIRTLVGNAFGCDQKCEPESACTTCKETLVVLIREIESAAYRKGKNDAVDYICKNSEEAVPTLFYVTNTTLEEARTKEPFDKK